MEAMATYGRFDRLEDKMSPSSLSAWLAVLLSLPPLSAAAAPTYSLTPVTGKFSHAVTINNPGQIAINNVAQDVPYQTGYIAGPTTSESVGTLGGFQSSIFGMNNKGEAVGHSTTSDGALHAFLYSGGQISDLSVRYGLESAADINDRGDIAGQVDLRGAVVRSGGKVHLFGPQGTNSADINNRGDVVGDYTIEGKGDHAFLYRAGELTDLGTLGGSFSAANAVNDADAVVGYGTTAGGQYHAFLYDEGVMTDLGRSTTSSAAYDINKHGQVVGTMDNRAFLYADGKMTDLNTLIAPNSYFLLTSAFAINDGQQILANACDPTGTFCYSGVRLDPIPAIPEPASVAMLLAGSALLGMRSFGRRCSRWLMG